MPPEIVNAPAPASAATAPPLASPAPAASESPQETPSLSIADHAAQFGPQAETSEDDATTPHHSQQQRRDKSTGEFQPGKRRAKREAVERIGELTARSKTAEERVAELEAKIAAIEAAPKPPVSVRAPAAGEAPARAPGNTSQAASAPAVDDDPKPDPKDAAKYADGVYDPQYIEDLADWKARKVLAAHVEKQTKAQQEQEALKGFSDRITAARAKYPDYDTIAFGPTTIPPGSVPDLWIMEHAAGPDVLYYLQSHPQERDEILRLPVLQQVERLALLSQQWSSSSSPAQAGMTGAAAGSRTIVLPPRPPTPVRTEAQRTVVEPPTDGSLSIAEHRKAFGPKARR